MKQTLVRFERVRDCPYWIDGICTHPVNLDGHCEKNKIAFPPKDCPIDDLRGCFNCMYSKLTFNKPPCKNCSAAFDDYCKTTPAGPSHWKPEPKKGVKRETNNCEI